MTEGRGFGLAEETWSTHDEQALLTNLLAEAKSAFPVSTIPSFVAFRFPSLFLEQ